MDTIIEPTVTNIEPTVTIFKRSALVQTMLTLRSYQDNGVVYRDTGETPQGRKKDVVKTL